MDEETVERLTTYVETLEVVNKSLLDTLKMVSKVLEQLSWAVPDRDGWEKMLSSLRETIEAAESIERPEMVH